MFEYRILHRLYGIIWDSLDGVSIIGGTKVTKKTLIAYMHQDVLNEHTISVESMGGYVVRL